ncbi:hypothetical protein HNP46_000055 [Pseudomonas nitritireducens]|uniref:Uncharacterized protein n=1 Tax=Pseudomonas nitroreducens TaxID=46680 RepID=A0A7W7NZ49_PSENT|nr:hypothetical protein [Pseudomonas nitritireducens]MBB4861244.1 hypothetical protein [Pseudomonas nitritireducens]
MTNEFVPFNEARKALVAAYKARLTDPENLKRPMLAHGVRPKKLSLRDYGVYAALRGADYRKTNISANGADALGHIENELQHLQAVSKALSEGKDRTETLRVKMTPAMLDEAIAVLKPVVEAGLLF